MKRCTKCKTLRPATEFNRSARRADGLSIHCKGCVRVYNVARYQADPKVAHDRVQAWRKKNPTWTKKHHRKYHFRRRYGLTLEAVEEMKRNQNNLCAVPSCGRPAKHVDHCHETKRVRGILCTQCNMTLGLMGDKIERIEGLKNYLKK